MTADVPLRELRNNTSAVLRRVEDGERITVTVNGRGVAQLVPLPRRPGFLPWETVLAHPADTGLHDDLAELLGEETTDDLPDPWSRDAR